MTWRAATRVRAWREQRSAKARGAWRPTDALRRGLVLGVALIVAGVLAHNLVPLVLGVPLLAGTALALATPLRSAPAVSVRPLARTVEPGQRARVVVDVEPPLGAELVAIRLPAAGESGLEPVRMFPATVRTLATRLRWDAWGEHLDLRPDHLAAGPDALYVYGPVVGAQGRRIVLPAVRPRPAGPLPPRAAGLVGSHRSRRPGDGTELRDIRPFQPGDRLRRVDWRVSLRTGDLSTLYIRERHAEADADVVLVLDTRLDVSDDLGEWALPAEGREVRPGGSLDVAVTTAVSLAASYLRQGDRVGLVDLGRPQLGVPVAAGRRQLLRLRHQLVACARSAGWAPTPVLRPEQVPAGALVVVLSPFLDDEVTERAVHAARRGNRVLAVNVLPTPLRPDRDGPWGEAVRRIITAEHELRLAGLRDHGIRVVTP